MILTRAMECEFESLVRENYDYCGGTISARKHALGTMLQTRRAELCELLTFVQPWSNTSTDILRDVQRVNAEITLLLIERGA